MTLPAHAPWALQGECIIGLARWRGPRGDLPEGVRRLPGPCVVAGVRYADSPVGPYIELAVAEPARLGARPGWSCTTMVVDSPEARLGGRLNWGFPRELGTLRWLRYGDEMRIVWEERAVSVAIDRLGRTLPVLLPVRALQRRSDGPVVVPGAVRGRVRLGRVTLEVAGASDPLVGLAGRHRGAKVSNLRFLVHPARHPTGVTSSLRAPLRAPEPALTLPSTGD